MNASATVKINRTGQVSTEELPIWVIEALREITFWGADYPAYKLNAVNTYLQERGISSVRRDT